MLSAFPPSQMRYNQAAKELFLFSAGSCAGFGAFSGLLM